VKEQGILDEVEARELKQAISLQIDRLLKKDELTKTQMAARMKTSRAAVDRLLDASNSSVTLNTLGKAAHALGRKVKLNWCRHEYGGDAAGLLPPSPSFDGGRCCCAASRPDNWWPRLRWSDSFG
jgi:antitoxin HicB